MEIRKTVRNFLYVWHEPYTEKGGDGLICESSAIDIRRDLRSMPGSSFLWIKGLFHLNREEIVEMVGYLQAWLQTGKLDGRIASVPKSQGYEIGDRILVNAKCWSGYGARVIAPDLYENVADPDTGPVEERRCVFRCTLDEPVAAVFVGWSYLLVGVRHPAYQDMEDGPMPPYFTEHDRIRVARWIPVGRNYLKPRAALPEDIEHVQ